ncbi:phosphatase [Sulfuricaulis limicola]|uniref:Phosphatase n=1 Tax=Sulfuricaulis limicola TaxID=1620215 RepID=A0A1B4XCY1_9GAMM|nr:alkaline phosphatase PhoX [Sulfuricaulis limicola]BAV32677.1 phosphatase [Sulfuricaulis limicola]
MKHVPLLKPCMFAVAMATAFAPFAAQADDDADFGLKVEQLLKAQSEKLFGVEKPLEASAPPTVGPYRTPLQPPYDQALVAHGLKVEYLTREAANATDMMAFYPAQNPTHLISCIEGGRQFLIDGGMPNVYDAGDKLNPSVQRINLDNGAVETILRGMTSCDGIRATAWGTILATEETSSGGAYEIFNPLGVTEQTVIDRASGTVTDPANIAKRTALPTMAWEGLAVLPTGVVIAGDELRPGTGGADRDGGAIFKFVPAMPRLVSGPLANLSESPLAAGSVYAMQVSCVNNNQQYGQGCEIGNAAWVAVNAATARSDADSAGATGYYRPEDLHQDPAYQDELNLEAVRFCWTNTGNEEGANYAEVVCGVDRAPLTASNTQRTVAVNRFVEGDTDFNSFDNLEFQPKTGNVYVIEDHDNGDIFACLPDGMDRDIKTDGCVKILSVKDSSAEPTGFLFDASGTTAYVSIQHSNDANMPAADGYPTDDVLKITGFKLRGKKDAWQWW